MTFTSNLFAVSSSAVEWSRPLMIGWLAIVLTLSVIEVWLMRGGAMADDKRAIDRWENEGGRVSS